MESWMISLAIAFAGVIATFAVIKYKVDHNEIHRERQNTEMTSRVNGIARKVDQHSETMSEHKISIGNAVTMEQVDARFLTRDLFRQHEKHLDVRFVAIEKKLESGFEEIKSILTQK